MSIVCGVNVNNVVMPREECSVRRQLDEMITGVDAEFAEVIDSTIEALAQRTAAPGDPDQVEGDFQDASNETTNRWDLMMIMRRRAVTKESKTLHTVTRTQTIKQEMTPSAHTMPMTEAPMENPLLLTMMSCDPRKGATIARARASNTTLDF